MPRRAALLVLLSLSVGNAFADQKPLVLRLRPMQTFASIPEVSAWQTVLDQDRFLDGALLAVLPSGVDRKTLPGGFQIGKLEGHVLAWGGPADWKEFHFPDAHHPVVVLVPREGWQKGTTYVLRVRPTVLDRNGAPIATPGRINWAISVPGTLVASPTAGHSSASPQPAPPPTGFAKAALKMPAGAAGAALEQITASAKRLGHAAYSGTTTVTTIGVPNSRNQIVQWGDQTLTYDPNGNLIGWNGMVLRYDADNRLTGAALPNGDTYQALHDHQGRKVLEIITAGGVTVRREIAWNGQQPIEVYENSAPDPTAAFVYGRGEDEIVKAHLDPNASGSPRAFYPLQDDQGNVTHLTNADGQVVEKYVYEGYGKFRIFDASNSPLSASAYGWNRLFQGREYIPLLDAYDFRARLLIPELGRFGQEDPAGYEDSPNLYQAFLGDWANHVDPEGRNWFFVDADKTWRWRKGNKATFNLDRGERVFLSSEYTHILRATSVGKRKEGSTLFELALFDQDKVVLRSTGFSGGHEREGYGRIPEGNYLIDTRIRDPHGPAAINPSSPWGNPPAFYGIQKIRPDYLPNPEGPAGFVYDVRAAYGPMRAYLNPMWPNPSREARGNYLHGQDPGRANTPGQTHGCLCYGADMAIIQYLWNLTPPRQVPVPIDVPVSESK